MLKMIVLMERHHCSKNHDKIVCLLYNLLLIRQTIYIREIGKENEKIFFLHFLD